MATEKDNDGIDRLLRDAGVRPSPARILTMRVISASGRPLSAQEIEDSLETLDRSSITRSLPLLVEGGLLHQISDGSGSMKYEACHDLCNPHHHGDEHAHFHCRMCGETTCLHELEMVMPELPEGYSAENSTYVITGLCPKCNR